MKITRDENKISVQSPYHPDLPKAAKNIGGKWNPSDKSWSFGEQDEQRVKELYLSVYGEWPEDDAEIAKVTLRVKVTETYSKWHSGIYLAGRCLATAFGRDSGARLGNSVIVIDGDGFDSGGSVKNWRTVVKEGTIFELRDIPVSKIEEAKEVYWAEVSVIGDIDKDQLRAEKERLLARIEEINDLLGG